MWNIALTRQSAEYGFSKYCIVMMCINMHYELLEKEIYEVRRGQFEFRVKRNYLKVCLI